MHDDGHRGNPGGRSVSSRVMSAAFRPSGPAQNRRGARVFNPSAPAGACAPCSDSPRRRTFGSACGTARGAHAPAGAAFPGAAGMADNPIKRDIDAMGWFNATIWCSTCPPRRRHAPHAQTVLASPASRARCGTARGTHAPAGAAFPGVDVVAGECGRLLCEFTTVCFSKHHFPCFNRQNNLAVFVKRTKDGAMGRKNCLIALLWGKIRTPATILLPRERNFTYESEAA